MRAPYEAGNSYGRGRPRGSRNKLANVVFNDVLAIWNEPVAEGSTLTKGKDAMLKMYRTRPTEFIKAVLTIMPREFVVENVLSDLLDEEIDQMLVTLRKQLADAKQPPMIEHVPTKDSQNVH